jgi:hypothetical protein
MSWSAQGLASAGEMFGRSLDDQAVVVTDENKFKVGEEAAKPCAEYLHLEKLDGSLCTQRCGPDAVGSGTSMTSSEGRSTSAGAI